MINNLIMIFKFGQFLNTDKTALHKPYAMEVKLALTTLNSFPSLISVFSLSQQLIMFLRNQKVMVSKDFPMSEKLKLQLLLSSANTGGSFQIMRMNKNLFSENA